MIQTSDGPCLAFCGSRGPTRRPRRRVPPSGCMKTAAVGATLSPDNATMLKVCAHFMPEDHKDEALPVEQREGGYERELQGQGQAKYAAVAEAINTEQCRRTPASTPGGRTMFGSHLAAVREKIEKKSP